MTYTQAQIDRANAANLEDFLRAQGETRWCAAERSIAGKPTTA